MMNLQRLSTAPAPLLRSVVLATGIAGLLATSGSEAIQKTDAAPRTDLGSPSAQHQLAGGSQPSPAFVDDPFQTDVLMAELSGAVVEAFIALDRPHPVVEAVSIDPPNVPPAQPAPVQVASADPSDMEIGGANKAVGAIEIVDECLVIEICVDRYLWALYQRTPKEDTIKVPERRKVSVKRKGRMVTVTRTFTRLVDQDFGWKDPNAAERVRMPMMDYVIGGMDRSFKLKLFHMLHAAEAAGLSPGITSAFRDDYRQSIASGLKAASNKSFHGGSSRGGYGHGLAADIVSVQGGTRDQRWASSDKLWKWVDAHGKEFGIGRPYLGRDPPHVAPVDGREYAAHNRGSKQASSDMKRVKRLATRDSRPVKRPRTAAVSKMKAS
jgi:hypothetical protein